MDISVLFFCIVIGVIYFIPTIIGADHKQSIPIFILNIFLGWTFIGWVIALVWASSKNKTDCISKSDKALSELKKEKTKLDLGLITQTEYAIKKEQLSKFII